ncbi:hypothetical protein L1049_024649 [Liquidambar formosana]|uniref:Uncharacterized protein n=1 Tax=Liquidambar formosana TaxID=63359 RepID=A0AAP0RVH8_LIQFO
MDHKHPAHPPLADDVRSAERGKTSLPLSSKSSTGRTKICLTHSLSEFLFCQFASWTSGLIKGFIIGASSSEGWDVLLHREVMDALRC